MARRETTGPQKGGVASNNWTLGTIVVVILLIALVFWVRSALDTRKAENTSARNNPPPAPTVVVKKVGKEPTTYRFSDYADSCKSLMVKVYDFHWYPKGGRVTVFPPNGAPSFVDTPGVDIQTHHGPGLWEWCPLDKSAWGVEVWM